MPTTTEPHTHTCTTCGNRITDPVDLDEVQRIQATGDPLDRLRSAVEVKADHSPDEFAVVTSAQICRDGVWTGLTHGDLRTLPERLGG